MVALSTMPNLEVMPAHAVLVDQAAQFAVADQAVADLVEPDRLVKDLQRPQPIVQRRHLREALPKPSLSELDAGGLHQLNDTLGTNLRLPALAPSAGKGEAEHDRLPHATQPRDAHATSA